MPKVKSLTRRDQIDFGLERHDYVTINDIVKDVLNTSTFNKQKSFPSPFIVYRMALIQEYHNKNFKLPSMSELSKLASNSWSKEPQNIKEYYKKLVKDAKALYNQNTIQIIFDKHMTNNLNSVENNQESDSCVSVDSDGIDIHPFENFMENSTTGYQDPAVGVVNFKSGPQASRENFITENSTNECQDPAASAMNFNVNSDGIDIFPFENFITENSANGYQGPVTGAVNSNNVGFPGTGSTNSSLVNSSDINNDQYIKMLEQTVDNLFTVIENIKEIIRF